MERKVKDKKTLPDTVKDLGSTLEIKSRKMSQKKKKRKKEISDSESEDDKYVPVRGRIVSGRWWKSEKKRAISAVKSTSIHTSFKLMQKQREDLKRVKELARSIEQERIDAILAKKKRREENLKRAEINRKKSEVVQVVKNSMKIKKMRKKQLRKIEKRDTTEIKKP